MAEYLLGVWVVEVELPAEYSLAVWVVAVQRPAEYPLAVWIVAVELPRDNVIFDGVPRLLVDVRCALVRRRSVYLRPGQRIGWRIDPD